MEFLDIVNENDEVITKASKDEVYEKFRPHRIVHVLIFNDKGEMALQLRSKNKHFFPHYWSTAVGGHVQSGETYEQAALREFREELGTTAKIVPIGKDVFTYRNFSVETTGKPFMIGPNGFRKMITTFRTTFNGPFNVNPEEVERVEFFPLAKIDEMIKNKEKLHPELVYLFKRHRNML